MRFELSFERQTKGQHGAGGRMSGSGSHQHPYCLLPVPLLILFSDMHALAHGPRNLTHPPAPAHVTPKTAPNPHLFPTGPADTSLAQVSV